MDWLEKDIRQWCAKKNMEAIKSGSAALGVFYKRSSVSAFRIAMLCQYLYGLDERYSMNGEANIRKLVKRIYLTMAEQILAGMLDKWGQRYEELCSKRQELIGRPRFSLFEQLPNEFSRELLRETIKQLDLTTDDWVFLSKWNAKALITKVSKNVFRKT